MDIEWWTDFKYSVLLKTRTLEKQKGMINVAGPVALTTGIWMSLVDFSRICFHKVLSSQLGKIISGQAWPHSKASQQETNCYQSSCHSYVSQYNSLGFPGSWEGLWFSLKNKTAATKQTNKQKILAGRQDTVHYFGAILTESNPKERKGILLTGLAWRLWDRIILCKSRAASLNHATQLHLWDGPCLGAYALTAP